MGATVATTVIPDESCTVAAGQNCDMNSYSKGKLVHVFPGGKTACMDSLGPFSFIFRKGDSDKLLFFFQGGGSCVNTLRYYAI